MSGKLGKFQMLPFTGWKGTKLENSLMAMGFKAPQKLTNVMVQLLSFYKGKTLESFLRKLPIREVESDDDYTWDVIGSDKRNIPLKEARDENNTPIGTTGANVGVNGEPFYLVFAEDYFFDGEVIFGELNEAYPIRVIGEPIEEGADTKYKVQLYGSNSDKGIPVERLQVGERFSAEYAPVAREYSRGVGGIRGSLPTQMRNEFMTVRIKHKVPGNRLNQKLAIGIPVIKETESGYTQTTMDKWIHLEDWKLEEQFSEYKNNAIMYGVSTRHEDGTYTDYDKGGSILKQGAGIRQQMEAGNIIYYNNFSIKMMMNAFASISATKLPFDQRTFVVKTGEGGAIQFHEQALKDGSGWQSFILDNSSVNVVSKTTSPLHPNALKAGYQFTELIAPNGVHVKIEVDPMYDDTVRNKIKMPGSQLCAESYRYDVFDIGTMDQPNIQLVKIKGDEETRSIQAGIRDPWTNQYSVNHASTDEDGSTIHKMATLGAVILDPKRVMSFVPAVLQY